MSSSPHLPASWTRTLCGAVLFASSLACCAAPAESAAPAQALRDTHQRLHDKLDHSSFGRPVQLDSSETPGGLEGDVYAVIDHPLSEVTAAFKGSAHWCELLTLHINNRRCKTGTAQGRETLTLYVVRRYDKPVDQAFELPFVYRVASATPEHLSVELSAASGPFGTSNYRVTLEAIALDAQKSFVHFSYGYDHNMMVRLATQAYLATFGRDKVGFTVMGKAPDGKPEYIRGLRGLVERNAMRYFLTLDAYLSSDAKDADERRQRHWFTAAEQYPRQLHEVDLDTYLALKREDRQRDGR
ncbi:hypothetical protein J2W32_000512 [Variovorax boronicumulans]|uniref:Uncharacterized protein n=2 Tax=Variovorax TaxID=34072 RepID=A0AAW8CM40_9BURK|nr:MULTISPECIES: hypothetical protein [Variovorax]ADU37844.1 hypothetical protein Varpa_3660 [Variovorax paradoxus EPS]MDP9891415.1 hypothetical protein [Variovorax boronicumulans]MDP9992176.1 hypothetical protein [Variovorax boronicumulans]MDQ0002071.1 hypothetical protein [Variovorax boronicumulans]MDQ0035753.1 hypothetical protein [Variovorax boronicumulans]